MQQAYRVFSSNRNEFGVECPSCIRVPKIRRDEMEAAGTDLRVRQPVCCPCGFVSQLVTQPSVPLRLPYRHRLSAGNFDLVGGGQNLAQLDKGLKSAAADEFFPMIQGRSERGMESGIFAQAFEGDDTHWLEGRGQMSPRRRQRPAKSSPPRCQKAPRSRSRSRWLPPPASVRPAGSAASARPGNGS